MPAFKFDPAEVAGIVSYVRNMDAIELKAIALGDRDRGQATFDGKGGCFTCHRVGGKGGWSGPNLSQIGSVRPAGGLEQSLLDPTLAMLPLNRVVKLTTRDGRAATGRRLNEDTYTVQLIDENGPLASFAKSDLRDFAVVKTSPMPSYKDKLAPGELADVLAYLLSLKGQK